MYYIYTNIINIILYVLYIYTNIILYIYIPIYKGINYYKNKIL